MRLAWVVGWTIVIAAVTGCYQGLEARPGGDLPGIDGEDTDTDGDGDSDSGVPQDYEPAPVALRLLLSHQYVATIRDLLGDDAAAVADPPGDTALNGFSAIGAAQLALGDAEISRYEASARAVAEVAAADLSRLAIYFDCTPVSAADDACLGEFVERFGRMAFRRHLEPDELTQYVAVGLQAAQTDEDFYAGIEGVIATMLQSPNFLYQVELGQPVDGSEHRVLTGPELATRMSYFLLGTTPDPELLDAAEAGELDDPEVLAAQAERLLDRDVARQALARFVDEVYRLRELETLPKDPESFPTYDGLLASSMRKETLALVEALAWEENGDFLELFDAPYTYVDETLAAHYGIDGDFTDALVRVELPPEQKRGGIFGHAGLLSILAHVTSTSPTLRGKFVREAVLCQSIPAPPPGVVTDLPAGETTTLRERLEQHMVDPSCAGCHELMDPRMRDGCRTGSARTTGCASKPTWIRSLSCASRSTLWPPHAISPWNPASPTRT